MARIFEIDITVESNTLIVGANGGNVVAEPGDRIIWRATPGTPDFTLEFFQLASEPSVEARKDEACEDIDVAKLSRWPFSAPAQPPGGVTRPGNFFEGILAGVANPTTGFQYYVTVGNLRLDPIVIIDP
jgi:hypothetical protein